MITPNEIKQKCLSWWKEFLIATQNNTPFFPQEINRIGRITPKELLSRLKEYKTSIAELQKYASAWGYIVVTEERNFEKIGLQTVPVKVVIPTVEVYFKITRKKQEFEVFQKNLQLIGNRLPLLLPWCLTNPFKLISHDSWEDTLKVCHYFLKVPRPNLYIRELPVDVHTKYIEENKELIGTLLDFLLPDTILPEEKNFERRHHLRYAEPLIRIRFLDPALSPCKGMDDISIPLSTFRAMRLECRCCLVTENKMNFLTLPSLPHSIALWSGGGFNISFLKDIDWLVPLTFYYWGDLDAQGFQILHQFRSYYPCTCALMMNMQTWNAFKQFAKNGTPAPLQNLPNLSAEEYDLYRLLQQGNLRLEQEKIRQCYAYEQITHLPVFLTFHPEYVTTSLSDGKADLLI